MEFNPKCPKCGNEWFESVDTEYDWGGDSDTMTATTISWCSKCGTDFNVIYKYKLISIDYDVKKEGE